MSRLIPFVLVALLLASPAAARGEEPVPADDLARANTRFAWDLYGALRAGDDNLFFSPYSVSTALMMTREGARQETAAQMDKVLHLEGVDRERGYLDLIRALRPPMVHDGFTERAVEKPAYEMTVANRLWGQKGYGFKGDFVAAMDKVYRAPLARLDFNDRAAARKAINDWVSKRTHGKIQDIVPPGMPPPLTRLALANAIYFKANWQDRFSERNTKDGEFTVPTGEKTKAKFMRRVGRYRYAEQDGAQILEIPYRSGHTSMVIFLPRAVDGLRAVEDKLVKGAASGWLEKLTSRKVDVRIPRFKFTCSKDLTATLSNMGMPEAFQLAKADFSGMTSEEKLFIGVVLHKAFIAVDEKGTEAAAATVTMMRAGSAQRPEKPVAFTADHPFAFVIRHVETGSILFAGRVSTPQEQR